MAKEKFLIVAVRLPDDCFGRFSETKNRAALDAGTADPDDAYSWIEASYEIQLRRWREATHICSFTPSAYFVWLQNQFVGEPNAAWEYDGDPEGLESESGGERHGYGSYQDEYDPAVICTIFTIDTVKQLGLYKPLVRNSLSRRTEKELAAIDAYHTVIWQEAEYAAMEIGRNGGYWCDALDVFTFRQREHAERARHFIGERQAGERAL